MKQFVTHPQFPYLKYYPLSGNFRWMISRGNRKQGSIAGTRRKSDGYVVFVMNKTRHYSAHRMAYLFMTGEWPEHEIDHDNGIRHDNRWENLKEATDEQNSRNRKMVSNNKTGTMGVYYYKRDKVWAVRINGKHIGSFKTKEDAIICRCNAEREHNYHPNHGKR